MSHHFQTTATWTGGLEGNGSFTAHGLESRFSAPKNLGGAGVGTNPEELLLGAASTCFLITLAAVLSRRKIPFVRLALKSELEVVVDGGLKATRVLHFPRVQLAAGTDELVQAETLKAIEAAEANCLVARAMSGNVDFQTTAEIGRE